MSDLFKNLKVKMLLGQRGGGSEIVQVVIVLGFALGLGAALLVLQGSLTESIENAGVQLTGFFNQIAARPGA